MSSLTVIGVRHHSPACARLVREVVRRERPRLVLIEGPSDMNGRLAELRLPHRLPIALFSWHQAVDGRSRGMWSPFCAYSPEWVALDVAAEVGAEARFIDLPAWHDAFDEQENRYADRHLRSSDRLGELAAGHGFDNTDDLWDHLFESPQSLPDLERRLRSYFQALRGDEAPDPRDDARESFMRAHVAAAVATGQKVVVVCGGFHLPALESGWQELPAEPPAQPVPPDGRVGSYLIPFSFRRLDAFAGYASGMPSPAYYQAAWEHGPESAAETMLHQAVRHLRGRTQVVSSADAIAAMTLTRGLQRLRGHPHPTRADVLDGLAGALVKEALDVPLPWPRRGLLPRRTSPLLVELVACFAGDQVGALAPGTPLPPLVRDARGALDRAGIDVGSGPVRPELELAEGHIQSQVLHRLRILEVPGFVRRRGPDFSRHRTDLTEEWSIHWDVETDAALIEASVHGGTLEIAAATKLESRTQPPAGLERVAEAVVAAAQAGLVALRERWLRQIEQAIAAEPAFASIGAAATRLLALHRGELLLQTPALAGLQRVLHACFDRGLWLFEGLDGASASYDEAQVMAVLALRRLAEENGLHADARRAVAAATRVAAAAPHAPPHLRGAALGMAWRLGAESFDDTKAIAMLRACARPSTLGDFLSGLFVLARDVAPRSGPLLLAVDAAVGAMAPDDFLVALPALRQAFSYFPPRERLQIAEALLGDSPSARADAHALVKGRTSPAVLARGVALDRAAASVAGRYGLGDAMDDEVGP